MQAVTLCFFLRLVNLIVRLTSEALQGLAFFALLSSVPRDGKAPGRCGSERGQEEGHRAACGLRSRSGLREACEARASPLEKGSPERESGGGQACRRVEATRLFG